MIHQMYEWAIFRFAPSANLRARIPNTASDLQNAVFTFFPDPTNSTDQAGSDFWPDKSFAIAFLLLIPFALVGNIFVIRTVFKVPRMKSPTNILFVNMAVCDILTAVTMIPQTGALYYFKSQIWFSGTFGIISCKTVWYVGHITIAGSIIALTLMAIDRYFAICHPILKFTFFKRYKTVSALVWVPSIILLLPVPIFVKLENPEGNSLCYNDIKGFWNIFFYSSLFILLYLVPLFIMAVLYGIIAKELWSNNTRNLVITEDDKIQKREKKKRKVVKMLMIVLVTFAVCWLPMQVIHVMYIKDEPIPKFIHFALWFYQANSAINPFLYITLHSGFRKAFKACLHKCGLPVKRPAADEELQTLRPQATHCTTLRAQQKFER